MKRFVLKKSADDNKIMKIYPAFIELTVSAVELMSYHVESSGPICPSCLSVCKLIQKIWFLR